MSRMNIEARHCHCQLRHPTALSLEHLVCDPIVELERLGMLVATLCHGILAPRTPRDLLSRQ